MNAVLALSARDTALVLIGFAAGAVGILVSPLRRGPAGTHSRQAAGSRPEPFTPSSSGRATLAKAHCQAVRRPYDYEREAVSV